jgi:hypothetical protein
MVMTIISFLRHPGTGPGPVAGHRDLRLRPLRNSASTSARRYRGLPVSLRTSGRCPRRAHVATEAEVTRNRTATCLRVIRSSSMQLPVIASGSLVDRNQLIRGRRRLPCAVPGKARAKGVEPPGAACIRNGAASCSSKHRSVDGYWTTSRPQHPCPRGRPSARDRVTDLWPGGMRTAAGGVKGL